MLTNTVYTGVSGYYCNIDTCARLNGADNSARVIYYTMSRAFKPRRKKTRDRNEFVSDRRRRKPRQTLTRFKDTIETNEKRDRRESGILADGAALEKFQWGLVRFLK